MGRARGQVAMITAEPRDSLGNCLRFAEEVAEGLLFDLNLHDIFLGFIPLLSLAYTAVGGIFLKEIKTRRQPLRGSRPELCWLLAERNMGLLMSFVVQRRIGESAPPPADLKCDDRDWDRLILSAFNLKVRLAETSR